MAKSYIYLRPSADISVGHPTKYPADSTNAYSLINEETSDGSATYIAGTSTVANDASSFSDTSSFKLSGSFPSEKFRINDTEIYVIAHIVLSNTLSAATGIIYCTVTFNGVDYELGYQSFNSTIAGNTGEIKLSFVDPISFSSSLNEYFASNGIANIPNISITCTTTIEGKADSKYTTTAQLSTLYLQLSYDICVQRKAGGDWHRGTALYEKVNGIWSKIENGYDTIASRLPAMGHHQVYSSAVSNTCTTDGKTEGYKCGICGEVFVPQTVIPATGHDYIASGGHEVCTRCQYIKGIGNVELTYNSVTTTPLSAGRSYLAATTVGNYALFAGGFVSSDASSDIVDAYNTSLTRTTATPLSIERHRIGATTVGNYALFAGGVVSIDATTAVDAYNASLTRSSPANIVLYSATYARSLAATTVGNYAIFNNPGGSLGYMNVYDTSLTQTRISGINIEGINNMAATTVGNYALFGGGGESDSKYGYVDAFDASLTATSAAELSVKRRFLRATTVGNYALFGGGESVSTAAGYRSEVDAYNTSLTRTTATPLSAGRHSLAATTLGNYALFGGGVMYNSSTGKADVSATVDIYDISLTKTTATSFSVAKYNLAATTLGNYALFGGGGALSGGLYYSDIESYTFKVK